MVNKKDRQKKFRGDILFFVVVGVLVLFAMALAFIKIFYLAPGSGTPIEPMNLSEEKDVRQMYVAGQFYPAQQGTLSVMVDSFLRAADDENLGTVKAIVVPHAGYIYSGQTAGWGFKQLASQNQSIKTVFILGSNHVNGAWFNGISIPNYTHYKTPLGEVRLSTIAKELQENPPFTSNALTHTSHIIEVELPFLQRVLAPGFKIVPMVLGSMTQDDVNDAAKAINDELDSSSLVVVSTDLSHYYPYDTAVSMDRACISQVENQSFAGVTGCEACGRDAILVLLRISEMNGWKAKIINYTNSGDTAGTKDSVVGYSAIVFYTDDEQFVPDVVNSKEQQLLLKLARDVVETWVSEKKLPNMDSLELTDTLKEQRGCFVTLNEHGSLRGCIGHILPQAPLYKCVIENAINAATADPRFNPVQPSEFGDIEIDVSVLTLPQDIEYSSEADLLSKLRPDVDGVVLRSGFRSSTFLPQVWEQIPDKTYFMESLCQKQGSAKDCWKTAKVSVYQAQVFSETD
ncbi:AmmeMemoRadiSam system protein B [Candidatus Woesearchaeota archaeon]|nr:AmmeMemoRadiSam system protein B [Candidatus Woesearchaeota archaeon]